MARGQEAVWNAAGPEAKFSLDNDRLRFVSEYRALVPWSRNSDLKSRNKQHKNIMSSCL